MFYPSRRERKPDYQVPVRGRPDGLLPVFEVTVPELDHIRAHVPDWDRLIALHAETASLSPHAAAVRLARAQREVVEAWARVHPTPTYREVAAAVGFDPATAGALR